MAKKFRRREDKNKKRNAIIMGVLLVGLMIFSVVGFAFQSQNTTGGSFEHNGFSFSIQRSPTNTLYFTEVDGLEIGFYNDPFFIESQGFDDELRQKLPAIENIIFTSKPISEALTEGVDLRLLTLLERDTNIFTTASASRAFTASDPFEPLPVRTCNDANNQTIVFDINFGITNETSLISKIQENCYAINGINFDFILVRDFIIYSNRMII
ncbi:MAG: hypothetical protein ACMXX9_02520 [Candidatus Woesearchaeota archaeon]